MAPKRKVSKFASPIDKRPVLNEEERDICSEKPAWENAASKIKENVKAANKRGVTQEGKKPQKFVEYTNWLKFHRGGVGESKKQYDKDEAVSRYEQRGDAPFPQVNRDKPYHTKKRFHKSLIMPRINFLSSSVMKDMLPKEEEKDDMPPSSEAFDERRKPDDERQKAYNDPTLQFLSADIRRKLRDWGDEHLEDIRRHKNMPYLGLSPEWTASVFGPEEAKKQVQEMQRAYMKVGIHKDPMKQPLNPEETERLNEYLKTIGEPEVEVPTKEKQFAQSVQQSERERQDSPSIFDTDKEKQLVHASLRKAGELAPKRRNRGPRNVPFFQFQDQSKYDSGLTPSTDPDRHAQGSSLNQNNAVRTGHKKTKKLPGSDEIDETRYNTQYMAKSDTIDSMIARQNKAAKAGNKLLAADLAEKIGQLRRKAGPSEKDLANIETGKIWRQQKESLKTPDVTKSLINRINRFVKEH